VGLVTKRTVFVGHRIIMTIVTTQTGGRTDMGPVTGNTISVMGTQMTGRQLLLYLLMTAGTDGTRSLEAGDIIP